MEEQTRSERSASDRCDENGFSLQLMDGKLTLSGREWRSLSQLFTVVDADGDFEVGGQEGAAFLRRARLQDDVLKDVWRLACGGKSKPALGREEWFVAMKLVAQAQSGRQPDREDLLKNMRLPMPNFGIVEKEKDFESDGSGWYPPQVCQIFITNPTSVGTGMSRHVVYSITTNTTVQHFLRQQATVTRRYSDFRWLHRQLRDRFPGTILPPLPGKKVFGNLSATFVEERRLALEMYIGDVARHPKLSKCFDVAVFLDASEEGLEVYKNLVDSETARLKLASESSTTVSNEEDGIDDDEEGTGESTSGTAKSWFSKLVKKVESSSFFGVAEDLASGTPKTDNTHLRRELVRLGISHDQVGAFRAQLNNYSERLQLSTDAVEKILSNRRAQGYELARMSAYVQSIAQLESTLSFQGSPTSPVESATSSFFSQIASNFEKLSDHVQDQNDRGSKELLAPLQYIHGKVHSAKVLLDNFDNCIKSLRVAHDDLALAKKRYASARAKNGSVQSAQQNVFDAEARISQAEQNLIQINQSVQQEIQMFYMERFHRLHESLVTFVQTEAGGTAAISSILASAAHLCA